MKRCSWCNTDPDEAAKRHEAPHATWCVHYRTPPLPRGVKKRGGVLTYVIPYGTKWDWPWETPQAPTETRGDTTNSSGG